MPLPSQKTLKYKCTFCISVTIHYFCLCVVQANACHCPPFSEFISFCRHLVWLFDGGLNKQDTTNTEKTSIYPCYVSDSNP